MNQKRVNSGRMAGVLCAAAFFFSLVLSLAGIESLRSLPLSGNTLFIYDNFWLRKLVTLAFYLAEAVLLLWAFRRKKGGTALLLSAALCWFLYREAAGYRGFLRLFRILVITFWPVILMALSAGIRRFFAALPYLGPMEIRRTLSELRAPLPEILRMFSLGTYLAAEGLLLFAVDYVFPSFYHWSHQSFADEFVLIVLGGAVWMMGEEPDTGKDLTAICLHDALLFAFMAGNRRMGEIFSGNPAAAAAGENVSGSAGAPGSAFAGISYWISERARMVTGFWTGRYETLGEGELNRILINCPLARIRYLCGARPFFLAAAAAVLCLLVFFAIFRSSHVRGEGRELFRAAALGLFLRGAAGIAAELLLITGMGAAFVPGAGFCDYLLLAFLISGTADRKRNRAAAHPARRTGELMRTGN